MSCYVIIRGPAGVGKTVVAKKLANNLTAKYISYDDIMRLNKLDDIEEDGISSENFIKANELVLENIREDAAVVLDGCFYRMQQVEHLLNHLGKQTYIFTLEADTDICLKRNKTRKTPLTDKAVREVHSLVSNLDIGIKIETKDKSVEEITQKIQDIVSKNQTAN